jgi:ornithine cyclodeaminase/alanine dehydrogenase-like protein (mu-crystallin family)
LTAAAGAGGTFVLSRRDVTGLMEPADWLAAAETAFAAAAAGRAEAPPPMHIAARGGAFHAKGAWLDTDRRYVALKLNGNFPANSAERGLPTIQGAILLCDGADGTLLAILDSMEVTLRRTAAATALAARYLARPDSRTALVCGCGEQGRAQLQALRQVLPLRRALLWDRDAERTAALVASVDGIEAEPVVDLAGAARQSDVIVTCTTAREPFLGVAMVAPGTFIAAVGADSPDKSEIAPDLMARARIVTDLTEQCAEIGDLRHAIAAGAVQREDVHAELAQLVSGARPGRIDAGEIILFDSTGTALQDVAAAALIHARALGRPDLTVIELGAP